MKQTVTLSFVSKVVICTLLLWVYNLIGSEGVNVKIQDIIDNAVNGSTIEITNYTKNENGYQIDYPYALLKEPLKIKNKNRIKINFHNIAISLTDTANCFILIENCENIKINNLDLNRRQYFQEKTKTRVNSYFKIINSKSIDMSNVQCFIDYENCSFTDLISAENSSDITIDKFRGGFSNFKNCSNIVISNSTFNTYAALFFDSKCINISIHNNDFGKTKNIFSTAMRPYIDSLKIADSFKDNEYKIYYNAYDLKSIDNAEIKDFRPNGRYWRTTLVLPYNTTDTPSLSYYPEAAFRFMFSDIGNFSNDKIKKVLINDDYTFYAIKGLENIANEIKSMNDMELQMNRGKIIRILKSVQSAYLLEYNKNYLNKRYTYRIQGQTESYNPMFEQPYSTFIPRIKNDPKYYTHISGDDFKLHFGGDGGQMIKYAVLKKLFNDNDNTYSEDFTTVKPSYGLVKNGDGQGGFSNIKSDFNIIRKTTNFYNESQWSIYKSMFVGDPVYSYTKESTKQAPLGRLTITDDIYVESVNQRLNFHRFEANVQTDGALYSGTYKVQAERLIITYNKDTNLYSGEIVDKKKNKNFLFKDCALENLQSNGANLAFKKVNIKDKKTGKEKIIFGLLVGDEFGAGFWEKLSK